MVDLCVLPLCLFPLCCHYADDEVFPFYELRAAAVDLRSGEAYVRCCVGHCHR